MQSNKFKVLLAEDHEDTRDLFILVLEQGHYEVVATSSVRGALDLARNQKFDIFLLDSRLTDGSGLDLCRSIRMVDKATPILFCSANAFEKDEQEALDAGAQAYLVKPIDFSELCDMVSALIMYSRATSPLTHQRAARRDSGDLPLAAMAT